MVFLPLSQFSSSGLWTVKMKRATKWFDRFPSDRSWYRTKLKRMRMRSGVAVRSTSCAGFPGPAKLQPALLPIWELSDCTVLVQCALLVTSRRMLAVRQQQCCSWLTATDDPWTYLRMDDVCGKVGRLKDWFCDTEASPPLHSLVDNGWR